MLWIRKMTLLPGESNITYLWDGMRLMVPPGFFLVRTRYGFVLESSN